MEVKELEVENPNVLHRTKVGGVVISTISLNSEIRGIDLILGIFDDVLDRPAKLSEPGNYESMVFECDPEGEVTDWTEKDFRRYSTDLEAFLGHYELVEKWSKE
jgi:hypothetical protein